MRATSIRSDSVRPPLAGHRVVLASRHHPYFLTSGTGTYISAIIDGLLDAGATVRLLVTERPAELGDHLLTPDRLARHRKLSSRIDGATYIFGALHATGDVKHKLRSWADRAIGKIERTLTGTPAIPRRLNIKWPDWDEPLRPSEAAFLSREVKKFRPHSILLNYSWMAPFASCLPKGPNRPKSILLTLDVRHQDCVQYPHGIAFRERTSYPREREVAELSQVDAIVAIQSREARHFKDMVPNKDVITLYPPVVTFGPARREPVLGSCLLVGSNNAANGEGARWFLDHVWPLVLAKMSTAELRICGDVGNHAQLATIPTNVLRCGRVPDLTLEYARASVVVAPLLFGSGIKLKVTEALSHGCAVVGTSVAMDGIEPLPDTLLGCNQPEAFAARMISLLKNSETRAEAERAALKLAHECFSAETCLRPLVNQIKLGWSAPSNEWTQVG